jgi:hypothetical protein
LKNLRDLPIYQQIRKISKKILANLAGATILPCSHCNYIGQLNPAEEFHGIGMFRNKAGTFLGQWENGWENGFGENRGISHKTFYRSIFFFFVGNIDFR